MLSKVAMRVVLLFVGLAACGATAASRAITPLDPEPAMARSGCIAVLETLDVMLRNPPAEMARRTVQVPGHDAPQPYTSTEAFMNETLRALCGSLALAQYRTMRSFWGERSWVEDTRPDYTQSNPVEPRLADLCRRMVRSKRRKMAASMSKGKPAVVTCDAIVGTTTPTDVASQLTAIAAAVQSDLTGTAWRLLPFGIVALALPFVLRPIVTGTPQLPEPRGLAEPGDADYDAADTGVVGCVPGLAGAGAAGPAFPRKKGKKT